MSHCSPRLCVVLFSAFAVLLPPPALAQTQTGTITGVVTDEQAALLPGVTVTLDSPAIIRPQTVVSNERGVYSFIALPPGAYSLKFDLQGFASVERRDIRVNVAVVSTVDLVMKVAAVTETIQVTGESPAVDVKSTSKGTNFDSSLLTSIPQAREIWSTVEQVPGSTESGFNVGGAGSAQQSGMAVHGSAAGQQEYAVNGLKLNWPGGNGGATAFYFDQDSFAEINVMTNGAPAEVATGGVYMNTVTKSGGNELKGGTSIYWEDQSFQGNNVSDALRAQGVTKGNPINHIYDFNANVGGPLKRDKAWFFSSFRRFDISTQVLGITRPDGSPAPDLNHQSNVVGKVTAQLNDKNKISGEFNFNYQNRFFRRPTSDLVQEQASWRQIEPAYISQFQWTSLLTPKLFLDARYGFLHLVFPLHYQPEVGANDFARQDIFRHTLTGAATYDYINLATRHQANVSASYFVNSHSVKTGFEYGRAFNQNQYAANGNEVLRYFDGSPLEVQTYNTPITGQNYIDTVMLYAQDSWVINRRLTVNYGGRFERLIGFAPPQSRPANDFFPAQTFDLLDNVPSWNNGLWRLGCRVRRERRRQDRRQGVLRPVHGPGRNPPGAASQSERPRRRLPELEGRQRRRCGAVERARATNAPVRRAGKHDRSEPQAALLGRDQCGRGSRAGAEPLGRRHVLYRRHNGRRFSGINVAVPASAYTTTTVVGADGQPVTVYNQAPSTLSLARRVITNIDGLEDTYNGVEFTATKRMANRWQMIGGFTIGQDKGVYDSGLNDDFNNPNANINRQNAIIGMDSTYVVKLIGTYVFPRDVTFSTNFRYFTGQPVQKLNTVTGLTQGTVSVLAEPVGTTRLDNVALWDARGSKIFRFGRGRELEAMVDVFNLLNRDAKTIINNNVGPLFGNPIAILPPRVARLGVRFAF